MKDKLIGLIDKTVETSKLNTLKFIDEKAWDSPIVAFASGSDPLYSEYKTIIGDVHWTPAEVMSRAYPEEQFSPSELSIVCWVLPQTEATRAEQRTADKLPADRWIHSRHYGEEFNNHLRQTVQDFLRTRGIKAAAPLLTDGWGYQKTEQAGICSNWSERHSAYAAGMGTFSLSDGFITEKGKAVRIGTVVFESVVEPDVRTAETHTANCLYYAKGTCKACIKRCPADAISEAGHDKQICHDYIRAVTAVHAEKVLKAYQTPCGLCQVKIPCESQNPMAQK